MELMELPGKSTPTSYNDNAGSEEEDEELLDLDIKPDIGSETKPKANQKRSYAETNEGPTPGSSRKKTKEEKDQEKKKKEDEELTIASLTCGRLKKPLTVRIVSIQDHFKEGECTSRFGTPYKFLAVDHTGEIEFTSFDVMGKYLFRNLEINECYTITKATVKLCDKRFHKAAVHPFRMCVNVDGSIGRARECAHIPFTMIVQFVPFNNILKTENGGSVDFIGIVDSIAKIKMVNVIIGEMEELRKSKDITLRNEIGELITCRLFGNHIPKVRKKGTIFIFKSAIVETSRDGVNPVQRILALDSSITLEVTNERVIPSDQLGFYKSLVALPPAKKKPQRRRNKKDVAA